ncbi:hypothetical protein SLS56_010486 [Neofusicoccum ribis]|uniref:Dolichyl-diphosphooligosaccharide-protein glycosyltransferase subunit OST5 n=1 Tax=Neofusicoccum ribis TaxID=45134 RepID=A0ABR3SEC8_9PEZI
MSAQSPLLDIWEASAAQPYYPSVSKNAQFIVGFLLLLTAFILTGIFGLSKKNQAAIDGPAHADKATARSIVTLPVLGVPASLAFGYLTLRLSNTNCY